MPDAIAVLTALVAAGGVCATIVLAFAWPWRSPSPVRAALGWALGAGVGLYAGLWLLNIRPSGQVDDLQRFLKFLIPAALLVELIAAAFPSQRWIWIARLIVAIGIAPTLLWGTTYLSDAAGPETRIWSPIETVGISTAIGISLTLIWAALVWRIDRGSGISVSIGIGLLCLAAGIAAILSGYISAGFLGFVTSAIMIAPAIASLLIKGPIQPGALGIALVSFVSILIMGRFSVAMTTVQALLLAASTLGLLAASFIPVRESIRGIIGVALLAIPSGIAVMQARNDAIARSIPVERQQSPVSGTIQDYLDFGK